MRGERMVNIDKDGSLDKLLEMAKEIRHKVRTARILFSSEDMLDRLKTARSTITDVITIIRRALKIGK